MKAIIESQNVEITCLKQKLDAHTNKIRLFLVKQSSKFQLKPLPKPTDLNEIQPNAFQSIDLQGLMQGIYKKTEEIFNQLNEKLEVSNTTIVKLREFIVKHSQVIESLQGKLSILEQENQRMKSVIESDEEKTDLLRDVMDWKGRYRDLEGVLIEKDHRISVLEKSNQEIKKHTERLEKEILTNKIKLSEAMNAAFETGQQELVEFFEKAIVNSEIKTI